MSILMNAVKKNTARTILTECCQPSQYWSRIPTEIAEKIDATNLTESLGLGVAGYVRSTSSNKGKGTGKKIR